MCLARHNAEMHKNVKKKRFQKLKVRWIYPYMSDVTTVSNLVTIAIRVGSNNNFLPFFNSDENFQFFFRSEKNDYHCNLFSITRAILFLPQVVLIQQVFWQLRHVLFSQN